MKSARELVDRLRAYQPPNTDLGQHFLIDDDMLERMVKLRKAMKMITFSKSDQVPEHSRNSCLQKGQA